MVSTANDEGAATWWIFAGDAKVSGKLFNRRAACAKQPVFDANGDLSYTVAGDLWKGSIEAGDAEEVLDLVRKLIRRG